MPADDLMQISVRIHSAVTHANRGLFTTPPTTIVICVRCRTVHPRRGG